MTIKNALIIINIDSVDFTDVEKWVLDLPTVTPPMMMFADMMVHYDK
jgi:hypothetical protein